MKAFQVLIIVGGILLSIGLTLTVSAIRPGSTTQTITIPAGAEWYAYYAFSVLFSGSVSGEFQVLSSGSVNAYVMTQAQYDGFSQTGSGPSAFATSGSSGTFSVNLPSGGKYFLVFTHGAGWEGVAQDVRTTLQVNGIEPTFFVGGIVSFLIGVALVAVGLRKKRQAAAARPPEFPAQPKGVVLYGPPSPEEPPKPPGNP